MNCFLYIINDINLFIDNINVEKIGSSTFNYIVNDNNYDTNINIINSVFKTRTFILELPSSSPIINDHDNLILFTNNISRDYNYSNNNNENGENYIFNFNSNGSSTIDIKFESNQFIENTINIINNNYYIHTNGPINIFMNNQTINLDSNYLYSVDPLFIYINNNYFGSNFYEYAINIQRNNLLITPIMDILILNSVFKNENNDYLMLSFNNIQIKDNILRL